MEGRVMPGVSADCKLVPAPRHARDIAEPQARRAPGIRAPAGTARTAPPAWQGAGAAQVDGKYYQVAQAQSLAERLAIRARDRIYEDFLRLCRPDGQDSILDVGASDVMNDAANVLERRYSRPERLTAVGLGEGSAFRATFPAVRYVQVVANERLPFDDAAFDIVTSNAVLEHVGSRQNQAHFVAELMRVGRRGFITVPHRFFPVEHHTAIPFLHWSDRIFPAACRMLGKQEWARAENLILMSRSRLRGACPAGADVRIGHTGLLLGAFSANLYLYWERAAA
jgi:hypothetical protein